MSKGGLKVAFAGTPAIAADILSALIESRHEVLRVATQPDRAAGRGRRIVPGAVKTLAGRHGLPVAQPSSRADFDAGGFLDGVDVLVVAAYGMLLSAEVLDRPRLKCINVHMSLLPRWRGAAPIQRAILAGDAITGVSIMQMDTGLDTGPVILQESCAIEPRDNAATLSRKLVQIGAPCLLKALDLLEHGKALAREQDEAQATRAPKISKSEAEIDWRRSAGEIDRMVRAFNPAPVAHTELEGTGMRIWEACVLADTTDQPPGSIIASGREGLDVAAGSGAVRILRLQLPGKKPISALEFHNARESERSRRLSPG